jgi:hypothetical protein
MNHKQNKTTTTSEVHPAFNPTDVEKFSFLQQPENEVESISI